MTCDNNSIAKGNITNVLGDVGNNKNNGNGYGNGMHLISSSSESDSHCNGSNIVISNNNDNDDNDDERALVFRTMKLLEESTYKRPHYKELPELFRGLWRKQIVEWMYVLIKYCKLKHEATAAAIYYLDIAASLSKSKSNSSSSFALVQTPEDYQLCAMTALHLALKVYDSPTVRIVKLNCLVKLGNGEFTENDIIQKEQDLLEALNWRLHPPTPDCFLHRYLELLPIFDHHENESENENNIKNKNKYEHNDDKESIIEGLGQPNQQQQRLMQLEETASEVIEIALAYDRFLAVPPSVIAYAALLQAMELTENINTDTNTNTNTTDYTTHTHTHRLQHHHQEQQQQQNCYYDWSVFLRNMKDVAGMGDFVNDSDDENYYHNKVDNNNNKGRNVSCMVRQTKMLLDRIIIQGLPLEDEVDDEDNESIQIFDSTSMTKMTDSCCGDDKVNHSGDGETNKLSSTVTISSTPPSPTSTMSSSTTTTTKTISSSLSTARSTAKASPLLQV